MEAESPRTPSTPSTPRSAIASLSPRGTVVKDIHERSKKYGFTRESIKLTNPDRTKSGVEIPAHSLIRFLPEEDRSSCDPFPEGITEDDHKPSCGCPNRRILIKEAFYYPEKFMEEDDKTPTEVQIPKERGGRRYLDCYTDIDKIESILDTLNIVLTGIFI